MIAGPVPNTALRKGTVVYVRNLKCASTFFYQNFKMQGWTATDYYDIDWKTDFVFSHIMDPIIRRHKGLAEYICEVDMGQHYLDSPGLQNILTSCLFLDRHGIPYSHAFAGHCQHIHWVPLIFGQEQNVAITQNMLNHQFDLGIQSLDWNFDLAHSTPEDHVKKLVEKQLQKQWNKNLYSVDQDLDYWWNHLYNTVKDPEWPLAARARDFYNLPQWIQQELFENYQSQALKFTNQNGKYKLLLYPTSSPPNKVTAAHLAILQDDIDLFNHVVETFTAH
jgi:hypothetical protein